MDVQTPQTPGTAKPVYITGMFDMHNFGDLMFPLIAGQRLAPYGIEVVPVSATGKKPYLADAPESIALPDALSDPVGAAGVIIGGGYIIHGHRLDLLREYRDGDAGAWVGPGTWLGATLLGALADVPVTWNAPGVPHPLMGPSKRLAAPAYAAADYLCVRDAGSRRLLGTGGEDAHIAPDTVIELPKLWSKTDLEGDFRNMLGKLGLSGGQPILAVHVRGRSLGKEPLPEFAAKLEQLCKTMGLAPVFVGLGSAHNDNKIANELRDNMSIPCAALDRPETLREVASLLAHAKGYAGSSLHGYVGAISYDNPAVLVGRPAYWKFAGFIEHVERPMDLAANWDDALARLATSPAAGRIPPAVGAALDRHWQSIADCIAAGPEPGRAGRMAFLRSYVQSGIDLSGTSWPFRPFATEQLINAAQKGDDVRDLEPV